jgi:hypothetical protein
MGVMGFDVCCIIDCVMGFIAPFGLPIISLCVAVVTILLRQVYGFRYWIVPLCIGGLSIGVLPWIPENKLLLGILAMAISLAFVVADTIEFRARPWLTMIVIPLLFLTIIFVGLVVGVNVGLLRE